MGSLKFFLHSKTSTEDKMNFSSVLLLVVAVVATSARPSDVDHHWEIFKANHPKATHLTEELVRKGLFPKVHQMIEEHNSGNHSYTMAHNMFSDMTKQEKEGYMGLRLPEGFETDTWTASNGVESRAPASLDWRTDSCLQPVKDQGQCGSCWAFSAIGSFEFQFCKTYGTSLALSEQQLLTVTLTTVAAKVDGTTMLGHISSRMDRIVVTSTATLVLKEAADTTLVLSTL